ncbi:MAG: tetratricopeptide repeat protein [Phycisphaerae bacterium]|nr:tetratricopeptide repeat protein [Phycisphaerae bacterium]
MSSVICGDGPRSSGSERSEKLRTLLRRHYEGKNHLRQGLCLLAAGKCDQAIEAFTAAAEANPHSLTLPTYLAAAHLGQGRFSEAAGQFRKIVDGEPADVRNRVRHALALWKADCPDQAIASLRAGVSQNPESAELHFQLATLLAARDETEEAELRFTQAAAIDKHHTEALIGLAMCHGACGNADEAVRCLKRAQMHNPRDTRIALLLAYALKAVTGPQRRPVHPTMPPETEPEDQASLEQLSRHLETEPDFVEAFLSLDAGEVNGEVFAMLAATIRLALERSPEHADLHYHCGCALERLGRSGEAIVALERAVGLKPVFIKALIRLAHLYRQCNRRAEARRRIEQALGLGAEYADVHYLLGNLYRDDGMLERARQAYRHALGINPHYQDAQQALEAVTT